MIATATHEAEVLYEQDHYYLHHFILDQWEFPGGLQSTPMYSTLHTLATRSLVHKWASEGHSV